MYSMACNFRFVVCVYGVCASVHWRLVGGQAIYSRADVLQLLLAASGSPGRGRAGGCSCSQSPMTAGGGGDKPATGGGGDKPATGGSQAARHRRPATGSQLLLGCS